MIKMLQLNLGSQYGGVERHIEDIVNYIDKELFKVTIVCRKNTKFEKKMKIIASKSKNIKVISIEVKKINLIKIIKSINSYINLEGIQIIHCHGITSSIIGNIVKSSRNKVITSVHGYSNLDRLDKGKITKFIFNFLEKISCECSDICIAVSKDIKRYLIEKKIDEKKIKVVTHGVSNKNIKYSKSKKLKKNIIISSIGRLEKVKGYDILIRAIAECKVHGYDKIKCKIAGVGSEREYLENLIVELDIIEQCELVGFKEDITNFLQDSDIYIQPSIIESFGISIIEAMGIGIPVIGTNSGGIKEIIDHNIDGMLFKKNNYKDLAEKIINLLEDEDKRRYLSYNGVEKVEKEFNVEEKIKNIEDIIKSLIY